MTGENRTPWGSRLGFILAASGSAIGLGNIVFFSARAYEYGGGAFYLPYLLALVLVGLPVLVLEFGLGRARGGAMPHALAGFSGRIGEFQGWWAILNAMAITTYYITLLGWVCGMGFRAATGSLFEPSVAVPGFNMPAGALPNPHASFFDMISGWGIFAAVLIVWLINAVLVVRGTSTIERAVKVMMPSLWVIMLALVLVGFTLPGGTDGMWLLVTPNFEALSSLTVWNGAFAQIFFTLSLGFGVMTAYASYLPKKSDDVANAAAVAGLNCLFELVAGLAVFSIVASFALTPRASSLSMMFFIVPRGIAQLPMLVQFAGTVFFGLLLVAGITSSISLVEACVSAIIDKFRWSRTRTVVVVCCIGACISALFALPVVIDAELSQNGTLGLTLLDFVDHYANGYGLMLVGAGECILVGWFMPATKLREVVNANSFLKLGPWFDVLIKFVIPGLLLVLIGAGIADEFKRGDVYGTSDALAGGWSWVPLACMLGWLGFTVILSAVFTAARGADAGGES